MVLDKQKLKEDLVRFSNSWTNTADFNESIYDYFDKQVDLHESLSLHNNVVAQYRLGYGEKAFRYLWALVFSQMKNGSKFLEIGVYKGSILALSQLVAKELEFNLSTYGLTPLDNTGDKYSAYGYEDYEYNISFLYHKLGLDLNNTTIIPGLSTDEASKQAALDAGPYDIVYIDGGHDYETVINDINLCTDILKVGGYLVMDDASSLLNMPLNHKGFTGHHDVGVAIRDRLDNDTTYKHLFACGHNRVWIKNK